MTTTGTGTVPCTGTNGLKKPGTGRVDSYAVTKKDVNEFENLKSFEIRS